jgi:hypothetical protein
MAQPGYTGPQARRFDRQNPTFSRAQLGAAANHSSSTPATQHSAPNADTHAQQDDDLQDVAPPQDPNISGMTPTEDCYTWLAGKLDGWKENDDYREFFENSCGPDSRIHGYQNGYEYHDNDYDDNGGFPTAIGHAHGVVGQAGNEEASSPTAEAYPVGIINRRYI